MEEQKKNTGLIILLIILIILLLSITGLYFSIKLGYLNLSTPNIIPNEEEQNIEEEPKEEAEIIILTEIEALNLAKEKFAIAEDFFMSANTYCGSSNYDCNNRKIPEGKETNGYCLSRDFTSHEELKKHLESCMTEEVLKQKYSNVEENYFEFTKDNYIEEDGKLYCEDLGKGGIYSFNEELTTYEIINLEEKELTVKVTAQYNGITEDDNYQEIILITMTKDETNNWQISKYEKEEL